MLVTLFLLLFYYFDESFDCTATNRYCFGIFSSSYIQMNLLSLYENPDNASLLYPRFYVEGVVLGAAAAPEIPMPDKWLPWAIEHHGKMNDRQQADEITQKLFDFFTHCLKNMRNLQPCLPAYASYDSEHRDALAWWLKGLLAAHHAMQGVWQSAWDLMATQAPKKAPKLAKKLKHCLSVFSTFADVELAIEQAQVRSEFGLADKLPLIAKSIPETLATYIAISGELAAFLPNQFETFEKKPV